MLWEKIARRYQGHPAVWGYDLVNEPVQNDPPPPGVADYLHTQVRAAKAIRAIDPQVPIFIAAAEWDSAAGFRDLEPVDVPNVIYPFEKSPWGQAEASRIRAAAPPVLLTHRHSTAAGPG